MKTIILAGGLGTRLGELTVSIPKPMVKIGDKPILWHLMNYYSSYGHNDFCLALGYKSNIIKNYFLNYKNEVSDLSISLQENSKIKYHEKILQNWNIDLINTGEQTMTGGRLKRLRSNIDSTFFLTYGDGLSNVDLNKLLDFHKSHKKLVTVTAVHPQARFGELNLDKTIVTSFDEKPNVSNGWINGGFFVIEPEFFDYIENDSTILEKEPLEKAAKDGELMAFKHEGFWHCMDTPRDLDSLNNIWISDNCPWK